MYRRAVLRLFTAGCVLAATRLVLRAVALLLQNRLNPTLKKAPYRVPKAVRELHERLLIADLHADPLLWDRDLLMRASTGHVDLPRLIEANVALQVFGVVTRVPVPEQDATFAHGPDLITPLSVIELWPPRTWFDVRQRALHQARRLKQLERRSGGRFTVVRSRKDLAGFLERRATNHHLVAGVLALEGAHALQGNLGNVDTLYQSGFRIVSLTHLFDNDCGGSSLGAVRYGLTPFGRQLLRQLDEREIITDLAHASSALFEDVVDATSRPIFVSHTGVQGICQTPRNLSDDQIRQVAERGGIIGIGFDPLFTCTPGVEPIAASIRYVADLVGVEHVALGSDFDGVIKPPFDVAGLPLLTQQLFDDGFSKEEIQKIMGANAVQFLLENLP